MREEDEDSEKPKKKRNGKRKKLESAWIGFFGRIVAQVVGALATVGLGILLVRSQLGPGPLPAPQPAPAATATPARALGQQRSVEEVFALLDGDRDGRLTRKEVPPEMWERMSRSDANGDGAITPGELRAARARAKISGEQSP
jgi:hypothetical protein